MPLINVKILEGVFTPAQKKEMVRKLTDTMVSIEGENMRAATVIIIEEVKSGNWGYGGRPISTKDVKAMAAGKLKGGRTTTSRGQQRLPRSARLRR
jgi:4-oxalocrotonate tautomerase